MNKDSDPLIDLGNDTNPGRGEMRKQASLPPFSQVPDAAKLQKQPSLPISQDGLAQFSERPPASKTIQIRRVLIIGKVGVGKKTIANILLGTKHFKIETHAVQTAARDAGTEIVEYDYGNYRYHLTIVDTGGLFMNNQESLRSIRLILKQLDTKGIGLLLFVIRKGGYFTMQDREQFQNIVKILQPSVAKISALIITGCENLKAEKRKAYVDTFKSDPVTRELAQFMQKGIFTVGFPDLADQDEEFRVVYQRKMELDEVQLRKLVNSGGEVLLSRQMVLPSKFSSAVGEVKGEFATAFCGHQ